MCKGCSATARLLCAVIENGKLLGSELFDCIKTIMKIAKECECVITGKDEN